MSLFPLLLFLTYLPFSLSTLMEKVCFPENEHLPFCVHAHKRFPQLFTTPSPRLPHIRSLRDEKGQQPGVKVAPPLEGEVVSFKPSSSPSTKETTGGGEVDDPSCVELRGEYNKLCFRQPPLAAYLETKAFCDAYVGSCSRSLTENFFSNIKSVKIDFTSYCKRHKERYFYVCPAPLRFPKFVEGTVPFCLRYSRHCPDVKLPSEPVPFKQPKKNRIWTREIKFARTYCRDKNILKVPRYFLQCSLYARVCIDPLTYVIYG